MATDDPFALPGQTPEDAARQEGSRAIGAALLRMARAAGTEILTRPAWPGAASTTAYAAPGDGIRYALMLRAAASQEVTYYVRLARESGLTWQQVGEILKPALWGEDVEGYELGEKAFEYVTDAAHAQRFDTLIFWWECPACGQNARDRGPYESNPLDNEPGHAEGCERMARLVAEHGARWNEED